MDCETCSGSVLQRRRAHIYTTDTCCTFIPWLGSSLGSQASAPPPPPPGECRSRKGKSIIPMLSCTTAKDTSGTWHIPGPVLLHYTNHGTFCWLLHTLSGSCLTSVRQLSSNSPWATRFRFLEVIRKLCNTSHPNILTLCGSAQLHPLCWPLPERDARLRVGNCLQLSAIFRLYLT